MRAQCASRGALPAVGTYSDTSGAHAAVDWALSASKADRRLAVTDIGSDWSEGALEMLAMEVI